MKQIRVWDEELNEKGENVAVSVLVDIETLNPEDNEWLKFFYMDDFNDAWLAWTNENKYQWKYWDRHTWAYRKDEECNKYAHPSKYTDWKAKDKDKHRGFGRKEGYRENYIYKEDCKNKYYDEHKNN